jgi:predicted dehydrogenase
MTKDFPDEGFLSYREEMTEFSDCVMNSKQPETGGDVGLRALAVIEAMVRSVASRRIVDMKEVLES